jgi:hypothetical protein
MLPLPGSSSLSRKSLAFLIESSRATGTKRGSTIGLLNCVILLGHSALLFPVETSRLFCGIYNDNYSKKPRLLHRQNLTLAWTYSMEVVQIIVEAEHSRV